MLELPHIASPFRWGFLQVFGRELRVGMSHRAHSPHLRHQSFFLLALLKGLYLEKRNVNTRSLTWYLVIEPHNSHETVLGLKEQSRLTGCHADST